jgi:adenylate cyclase
MGVGIAGSVAASGKSEVIDNAYGDSRFNSKNDKDTNYRTNNMLAVPVRDFDGNVVAVIQAINKLGGSFSTDDLTLVELLAQHGGVALKNSIVSATSLNI